jgi:hypothetical protein
MYVRHELHCSDDVDGYQHEPGFEVDVIFDFGGTSIVVHTVFEVVGLMLVLSGALYRIDSINEDTHIGGPRM